MMLAEVSYGGELGRNDIAVLVFKPVSPAKSAYWCVETRPALRHATIRLSNLNDIAGIQPALRPRATKVNLRGWPL